MDQTCPFHSALEQKLGRTRAAEVTGRLRVAALAAAVSAGVGGILGANAWSAGIVLGKCGRGKAWARGLGKPASSERGTGSSEWRLEV